MVRRAVVPSQKGEFYETQIKNRLFEGISKGQGSHLQEGFPGGQGKGPHQGTNAIVDFIEELFDGYSIEYFPYNSNSSIAVVIQANNVPLKEDSTLLLDKCIILNTYMQYYFIALEYLDLYDIHYWDTAYKEKDEMYNAFNFSPDIIDWTASSSLFISKSVV